MRLSPTTQGNFLRRETFLPLILDCTSLNSLWTWLNLLTWNCIHHWLILNLRQILRLYPERVRVRSKRIISKSFSIFSNPPNLFPVNKPEPKHQEAIKRPRFHPGECKNHCKFCLYHILSAFTTKWTLIRLLCLHIIHSPKFNLSKLLWNNN